MDEYIPIIMNRESNQLDIPLSVIYKKYVDRFHINNEYVPDKIEYFTLESYYLKYLEGRELAIFKETYVVHERKDDEFNMLIPKEYFRYKILLRNRDNNIMYYDIEYTAKNTNKLMDIFKYSTLNNLGLLGEYNINHNIIYKNDDDIYYNG